MDCKQRPDVERLLARRKDKRPLERVKAHYELETRLAERLRSASHADRAHVYGEVYNELFSTLHDFPQIAVDRKKRLRSIGRSINNIKRHLNNKSVFLEIGCGDALMSYRACDFCGSVYGMDVSDKLIDRNESPENFKFIFTDGVKIPLDDASVDVALSDQLMEHLHPDDAEGQLREICRVLKPGGIYWVTTPNRITGPHDVSVFFAYEAQGFHLKEYDYRSLSQLMRQAGFRRITYYVGTNGILLPFPKALAIAVENAVAALGNVWRARLTENDAASLLFGIRALATK